ncbi:formyltransferase family protein [Pseudanabaena sp. Chao 1811]|uniref:formyltransferase family protein n=1 Tax=Pseudanabaena sp. Chao 1811 TaxID=2963092 RepID=UPI0022F382BB|nr:formyltransferase family protein [Pseudanabaena sp. Chao 1811]
MIDLYLGGDIGLWALEQVPSNRTNQVFTFDKSIFEKAQSLNINVSNQNPNLVEFINSTNAISIHYPKIFKPFVISKYKKIYNLHPSYLPWGRGYYPIFWALWEDTPAGATLHEINEGIDEGDIVSQIQVEYSESDTGDLLFARIRQAEKQLFLEYFDKIADGIHLPALPQRGIGTYHSKQDFLRLKTTDHWQTMEGKELIKLIRCLTFDGYSGLEILVGQKRFEISLRLL